MAMLVTFLCAAEPALIIAEEAEAEAGATVRIFLLGGQSNMVGQGRNSELPPPLNAPFPRVKCWDRRRRQWVPLAPGMGKYPDRFGPEISFGHAMAEAMPDADIRLVKFAAGGSNLYENWAPPEGPCYRSFMKTAESALRDLDKSRIQYEIVGMLWLQGESDADAGKGDLYEENLKAFIAHIRQEFKEPEMPFVIARVLAVWGAKNGHARLVREAQDKTAHDGKYVACFHTDDCRPVHPRKNRGHYGTEGQLKIGKRFAQGYLKLVREPQSKVHPGMSVD
jgi:hypothetical protein